MKKYKLEFSIKKKEDLDKMTQEELLEYTKNLTDYCLNIKKPRKDSSNSSIAPSTDINKPKKNQSLREKSNKKSGGQKGHIGKTLKQTDTPDEVKKLDFNIEKCGKCGTSLNETLEILKEKRQILDLDLQNIQTKITEYQSFSKICPVYKFENYKDEFPKFVAPHISYGANINAIVSYLSVAQFIPYNRIIGILSNLFNIKISEGTIQNILKKMSKQSENDVEKIKKVLEKSDIVGIDETGCNINATKHWYWTFQNNSYTYIVANKSRGRKVIDENFENGFINACLVHDNFSSYNSLVAKNEQLCLAHKLRDLNYAIKCDDTRIMKDLKILIKEAMLDHQINLTTERRIELKENYEEVLDYILEQTTIDGTETQRQINSFSKAKDKIFTFLLNPKIPPDNNGSERAIRNIKIKTKVSGQFKSLEGAENYANIRTIIDTSRKQNINEFHSLVEISNGNNIFCKN